MHEVGTECPAIGRLEHRALNVDASDETVSLKDESPNQRRNYQRAHQFYWGARQFRICPVNSNLWIGPHRAAVGFHWQLPPPNFREHFGR